MSDLAPLAESVTVDPLVGHPADFHVFHQFLERCKELPAITTAVVWPLSDVALKGTVEAAEAKLILPNLKANEAECVPEGAYHVVSKLMDGAPGSSTQTNSTIYGDLRVQAGKLTSGVLRHRAATMTLKLVNAAGGEALANTSFSILTPGGDVIREMIGAFPSLVLAEGEYVVIARHDNKAYQTNFKVVSTLDRDVEVLTQ